MSAVDSAAPAASTPSSGGFANGEATRDDIAGIFAELEAADAGTDSSSVPSGEPVSTAAAPTTPPAPPVTAPSAEGAIPVDRHKAILEKTREEKFAEGKAAAASEMRQKLGWAESLDQTAVQNGLNLYEWLRHDPSGFQTWLASKVAGAASPAEPQATQPALRAEDGTAVYSADQLQALLDGMRQQVIAEVTQKYEPLRQRAEQRELEVTATREATHVVQQARTQWPLFTELESQVKQVMLSNPAVQLHDAYLHVFRERGPQMYEERFRTQQNGALADKLAATTTQPGPTPTTPRKYSEMDSVDVAKAVFAQLEGRS